MADFNFYSDNLDQNDEQNEEGQYIAYSGRDSVIIAVDCCQEMFEKRESDDDDDVDTAFSKILEAAKDMLRNKIISSESDLQGLILFGTRKKKNAEEFENIYVVQELDTPSAFRIEELQGLEKKNATDFDQDYGHSNTQQINEILWCCSSMFSRCSMLLATKTLIIFTWNDFPHQFDRNSQLRARTKAKDLMDQGIDIQVLSFNKEFKYGSFYKDIMSDPDTEVPFASNPIDGIKNLYDFLLKKCSKQRALGRIPFQLFDGLEMGVGVYTVARRARKGPSINIDIRKNEQVQSKTNFVHADTGDILMRGDIKLSQKWVGRDIVFEEDEVQQLRRFSGTGFILLGFKPREKAIKALHHVRVAQFIYPNEREVKGSSRLFSALLKKCAERDVVPICKLTIRSNSPPRCVVLLPQLEEVDNATGEQTQSPGFYVIYLPFSDDLRNLEIKEHQPPNVDQVSAAETVIKKLRFTYQPTNFDNPALQTHYRNLEALALDKDAPDEVEDLILPNVSRIDRKAGEAITNFKQLVFPAGYDPTSKYRGKAVKRKQENGGPTAKHGNSEIDMKEYAVQGKLAKLTVPILKEFCKNNGLDVTGKKKDLIDRIERSYQ